MLYFSNYRQKLFIFLLLKSFFMMALLLFSSLGLGPDESQYWTWSQELALGYYSKPPAIAWQIKLGTLLFGNNEFAVRFFSVIIAFFQAIAVFYLALACRLREQTAFWAALMIALCPIGIFGAFFAITDGGMLLCWTLASILVIQSLQSHHFPNPFLLGGVICIGAFYKWSIYLFLVQTALFYLYFFPLKAWLKRFLLCLAFSLLAFLPTLWWSYSHDWATFKHVSATLQGGHNESQGNFFSFIGAQVVLLSPFLFSLLLFSYLAIFQNLKQQSYALLFCFALSIGNLLFFSLISFFQKMQGNWILFTYPTSFILISFYAFEWQKKAKKWVFWGLSINIIFIFFLFMWPGFSKNYRKSPFKHNLAWPELAEALEEKGYDSRYHYLISDKYQTTSSLSFYSKGQKRAYFLNLEGHRKNQFSYWPSFQTEERGKKGYFVWVENAPFFIQKAKEKKQFYAKTLPNYFQSVHYLGLVPLLEREGEILKGALIFECQNCQLVWPTEVEKY